ncbi:hypothetical protein NK553_18430 [Pseudomonas sp. ZM23]|uniref:Tail tape measure protein n=1 Tax=Pseudomonas triclosanedens TaxID=2961893 RepID=A0ABY6ZRM4_9PSED|nr:hypothetical protein [Pseudomonas triclosanedens]MCP8465932.1 hypothetical protein [Pseudomonas triclosanedens]MCP8472253.1 hypothetical protein [Pseudomonas triclosanedens]MCP8477231.1 hypothetical protein [Pseudomonas triclosanedens]WAI47431.1 hypothetical protein OU419_16785 [Pseudomonas triclosanedens]
MPGKVTTQLVIDGKNNTNQAFNQVDGRLKGLSNLARTAGAAIAASLSVGVFANWAKNTAAAATEMARFAQLSGTSVEEFQAWGFAAKSAGIEQDKLGDIFKDVQDKVGDFLQTGGGELKDFFTNVAPLAGVTAEQFRNLSGPDALQLYVSTLEKANLSQSEMVFYLEGIANDAALLLPLLRNNAEGFKSLREEAIELGLILDSQATKNLADFNQNLNTLESVSDGASKQIAGELAPTLSTLTGLMVDVSTKSGYASQIANVLSFALKGVASVAIVAGNAFGTLGRLIGGSAAAASLAASGDFKAAADVMREVVEDNLKEMKLAADRVTGLWTDSFAEMGKQASQTGAEFRQVNQQVSASLSATSTKMKADYDALAKKAKTALQAMTAEERKAKSDVEKIRGERLEIERRYTDAIAQLNASAGGDADYSTAQSLKVGARDALRSGDLEGAKSQAQAALKVLLDLQAAGQNTLGFAGFAKELQAIELEANKLQQTDADQKLAQLTVQIEDLQAKSKIDIAVNLSPEMAAKVVQQMKDLAASIGENFVIEPKFLLPGNIQGALKDVSTIEPAIPQHANGTNSAAPGLALVGERGPELVTFNGGEKVFPNSATMNLMSRLQGLSMPDPVTAGMSAAAAQSDGGTMPNLGRLELGLGGETVPLYGTQQSLDQIIRIQRLKRGGTKR